MCPSAQSGWIGRARRIFAVWRGLLNGNTGGDALAGLLAATQGERRPRRQPIGQDREGLIARPANPASHPNAFVPVIVGWRSRCPWPMVVWSQQSGHRRGRRPKGITRVDVVIRLGQCDKENHGWRVGPPRPFPAKVRSAVRAFTLRQSQYQTKKGSSWNRVGENVGSTLLMPPKTSRNWS